MVVTAPSSADPMVGGYQSKHRQMAIFTYAKVVSTHATGHPPRAFERYLCGSSRSSTSVTAERPAAHRSQLEP